MIPSVRDLQLVTKGSQISTTSNGLDGPIAETEEISATFVRDNEELLWQEGYYRGYTELHISPEKIEAQYFGCPTIANRNAFEISLANFTDDVGEDHVARPTRPGRGSGYQLD